MKVEIKRNPFSFHVCVRERARESEREIESVCVWHLKEREREAQKKKIAKRGFEELSRGEMTSMDY